MTPTPEQVAQWAREAGAAKFYPEADANPNREENFIVTQGFLARLVTRAMVEQAEADAKLCENEWSNVAEKMFGNELAATISANAPKVTA